MSLLEYKRNINDNWAPLPTPSPQNYSTTKTHLEKSSLDAKGYLHRDIVRRNRNKIFCGYDGLNGEQTALLDSLYDLDYFYLRFTNNSNKRVICKVYAGPLEGKAAFMNKKDFSIKWRTDISMNFIEY